MVMLTRDQVLSAPVPTRKVDVPEWGGSILVRSLSPRSRIAILDALRSNQAKMEAYEADQAKDEADREGLAQPEAYDETILAVIFSVVCADLKPMFALGDYERFMELPYPTIQHIYRQMIMLEARAIDPPEEQKKSSGTVQKSGSSSGSRSRSARR